jgi:hypothetical protein
MSSYQSSIDHPPGPCGFVVGVIPGADRSAAHHVEMLSIIPIPDSFLGGSAPRPRYLSVFGFISGVAKPALSATQLVRLWLFNISHSGYVSPEAMVGFCTPRRTVIEFFFLNAGESRYNTVTSSNQTFRISIHLQAP